MKKNLLRPAFLCPLFLLLSIFNSKAQDFAVQDQASGNWASVYKPSKFFIENKGQFETPAASGIKSPVYYAYDEGSSQVLFTSKGIIYNFRELKKNKEEGNEEREREKKEEGKSIKAYLEKEREEKKVSFNTDFVSVEWEGANENVEIIPEIRSEEYFSYSFNEHGENKNVNYIYGYKKLIYKDLYPNIDAEFIFHPIEGIKYSFVLHPGADPSVIRLNYSDKLKLNETGDMFIDTKFGYIVEHAPQTFYQENKTSSIASKFIKNGKTISFQIGNYNKNQTIVIDPWVQTPTITNSNCVWECERDGAGNVYIIGGDSPMKLLKYNAAGALQWTFITAYDTANFWLGTLATDLAGNSYVTAGSTARLTKVTPAGAQVYNVTGGSNDEYWNITFNCDQTKLVVGGTRLTGLPFTITGSGVIFDINTATGNVTSIKTVGYTTPGVFGATNADEVRAITSSYNSRYYYMTLDSLGAVDQNFSVCPSSPNGLFKISHGYNFGYKCEDWRPKGNGGIKAIRANKNFLYTQNGTTIHKRSPTTGAILASAAIPGGISTASFGTNQVGNSGIELDTCGNVYVGSGNQVIKYDANLTLLSSTALPFHVYDVAVSTGGNVIVCGATGTSTSTSRTGYVQSINMTACNPLPLICCDPTICPAGPFCTTNPSYTLTTATAGGTWTGAGVNASGVFNPATAGPGTHAIIYTLACGKDSVMITVNVCASLSVCINGSTLTVSNGTPAYTWQIQTTTANCTACTFGCNFPPGCSTTVTSWSTAATGTNTFTPASYPVKVFDSAGNSYTITTAASVTPCTTCPTPTVSVVSSQSVTCFGANTGSATVNTAPAGTYTYTWQNGSLNGAAQTGLTAGIYTVTAVSGACSGTVAVTISQPTALSASITATTPASCGANNGNITVTASGGTAGYTYAWSPTGGTATSATNLGGGTYTVLVSDANSCTTTATGTVTTTSTPTLSVNSATLCAGSAATLTVTGATTYSWTPATGLSATSGASVNATPTVSTIYTVTGTAGSCSSTATSTVTVNAIPTATATGTALVCTGQTINLGVTTSATTFSWSGPNSFTSNIQNPSIAGAASTNTGVYTVTVTTTGCSAVSNFNVTVTNSTTVSITPAGPFCSGNLATNLSASVAGGAWSGTGITDPVNGTFNPAAAGVGTFTITYTIGGSCGSSDSTIITVNAGPTASASASSAILCVGQSFNLGVATTATSYSWTGPGGYSNNVQNPVFASAVLSNSGTYTVTVSAGGCTATDTISINVVSNPTITVNSAAICTGTSATLTANGAATYTWTPASGLNTSNGSVVICSTTSTTIYTVSGGVGTCSATPVTSTVIVNASPTVTVNNVSSCSSTSVTITASGANTYSWSPATGLNATTGSVVIASPGVSTNYTVTGTDVNGCVATATLSVLNSPSITTTVTTSSVTCNGLSNGSGTVTASGGTGAFTYSWSPFGGTASSASNISAGTYTCVVTDGIGCTATTTVSITQPATLSVSAASAVICAGQSYSITAFAAGGTSPYNFIWDGGTFVGNPYVVSPSSATSYTVVATDANGCTATDNSIVIAVRPPLQVSVGDAFICAGNTSTLTANAAGGTGTYSYNWMPGSLSGSNISVSPAATTVYTVTVSDGCTTISASDTGLVNVTPPPLIAPPVPASGCAPICINFTNPPGVVSWIWNFGDGSTSSQSNPTHCYITSGSFNIGLSYTTTIGCASTVTYSNIVNIFTVPQALFSASPNPTDILAPQVFFTNQSVNSVSWQWTFGDGSASTSQNLNHTYLEPGNYSVVLISSTAQGCTDTITENIIVHDIYTFYAPNTFSPNYDNTNPKFLAVGEGWNNSTFNMWIYDRWGNLLFKTQDPYKGWDGRINDKGEVVLEDVYVWKVKLDDIFGKHHEYSGTISLVK